MRGSGLATLAVNLWYKNGYINLCNHIRIYRTDFIGKGLDAAWNYPREVFESMMVDSKVRALHGCAVLRCLECVALKLQLLLLVRKDTFWKYFKRKEILRNYLLSCMQTSCKSWIKDLYYFTGPFKHWFRWMVLWIDPLHRCLCNLHLQSSHRIWQGVTLTVSYGEKTLQDARKQSTFLVFMLSAFKKESFDIVTLKAEKTSTCGACSRNFRRSSSDATELAMILAVKKIIADQESIMPEMHALIKKLSFSIPVHAPPEKSTHCQLCKFDTLELNISEPPKLR